MVVASEAAERFGVDVDAAIASGIVARVKVQGRWLYSHHDGPSLEETLDRLAGALDDVLGEWLVNPGQYLIGPVLRAAESPRLSRSAARVLVQELCHRQRLDGIALMTRSLQPYLAFFRPCDHREVERQVAAMRSLLERHGAMTWHDLPEPERRVPRKVWRMTIVAHGVWLGLGHQPQPGVLEAW